MDKMKVEKVKDPQHLKCAHCGNELQGKWSVCISNGTMTGFQAYCECNHITTAIPVLYDMHSDPVQPDDPNYNRKEATK